MSDKVTMDKKPNYLEDIAKALHDGWVQYKIEIEEFSFAPLPDWGNKKHNHLVPWEYLNFDVEAQNQDRFQATLILQDWREGKITKQNLPIKIHTFWALWEKIHGGHKMGHDRPYVKAHPEGDIKNKEHEMQAELVWPILQVISQKDGDWI